MSGYMKKNWENSNTPWCMDNIKLTSHHDNLLAFDLVLQNLNTDMSYSQKILLSLQYRVFGSLRFVTPFTLWSDVFSL